MDLLKDTEFVVSYERSPAEKLLQKISLASLIAFLLVGLILDRTNEHLFSQLFSWLLLPLALSTTLGGIIQFIKGVRSQPVGFYVVGGF